MRRSRHPGAGRPRHVGEDRSQPVVECIQVHARRPRQRAAVDARPRMRCSRSPTPASACRHTSCRACSSAFIAWKARRDARTKARESAWRWCRNWSSCMAASSKFESEAGRGTTFRVRIPFGHCAPARPLSSRIPKLASPRSVRRPTCRKRCAGCPRRELEAGPTRGIERTCGTRRGPRFAATFGARIVLADDNADMRDYVRELLGSTVPNRSRQRWTRGAGGHRAASGRTW